MARSALETVEHMARNTGEHKDTYLLDLANVTILMINTNIFILDLNEFNGSLPSGARRQKLLQNCHQQIITKNYLKQLAQKIISKTMPRWCKKPQRWPQNISPETYHPKNLYQKLSKFNYYQYYDQVVQKAATLASKERERWKQWRLNLGLLLSGFPHKVQIVLMYILRHF